MPTGRRTRHLAIALASCCLPAIAGAQDPVVKPTTTTTSGTRLAAPAGVTVRQLANDRVVLTWRPVAGAASYALWRSVPPAGIVALPTRPTDTLYYDNDVRPGSTYYYNVAAVDASGTVGLRAGGNPLTVATLTPPAPTSLTAALAADGKGVLLTAAGGDCASTRFRFERADAATRSFVPIGEDTSCPMQLLDALTGTAPGARLIWRVVYVDRFGAQSPPTLSNELTVGTGATPTTGGGATTAGSTTPSSAPVTGSTTFTVAPALSLRVGATSSLSSLGGARWVSMNESVASVDGSGVVSGRAAGTAQIVALAVAADGSLRVSAVRVTVSP